jgi:hypothetical protein
MITQILTIVSVSAITYLFLTILGSRPASIFLSLEERKRWNSLISSKIGIFMYIMNISATLTSLATVYIFFIGNSSLFGFAIYICVITIVIGSLITPRLTEALLDTPQLKRRMSSENLASVAIASLFWGDDSASKRVSKMVKIITLISISSILWLEFASLTKLSSALIGVRSLSFEIGTIFIAVTFVTDFVIRNGLRGFIFVDLLLGPLILLGILALCAGVTLSVLPTLQTEGVLAHLLASPKIPTTSLIVFCFATIFLNGFIIICSEAHWLRVWAMPQHVRLGTKRSGFVTALLWLVLIIIGLLGASLVDGAVGVDGVVKLVNILSQHSTWYPIAFWVGATAAILSVTDGQLYAGVVLLAFDTETGTLKSSPRALKAPLASGLVAAIIATIVYVVVEVTAFPFDQVVFFTLPFFLCLTPAFVQMLRHGNITVVPIVISVTLYLLCGLGMIIGPNEYRLLLSLAAPLMPLAVSLLVAFGVIR